MDVIENALESDRFGIRFARLTLTLDDIDGLAGALARADVDGIDAISVRTDALEVVRALEDADFRLMDTLVYHRHPLSRHEDYGGSRGMRDHAIELLLPDHAEPAARIARRAFAGYLGHYHADPRLADDAATEAYADWIHRAARAPVPGQLALGYTIDGALAGFILGLARTTGTSEITLNAVDPDAQRGGVYQALLHRYMALARDRGDHEVLISTQLQNYAVQRVWSRAGFLLSHASHTLHRWAPHDASETGAS